MIYAAIIVCALSLVGLFLLLAPAVDPPFSEKKDLSYYRTENVGLRNELQFRHAQISVLEEQNRKYEEALKKIATADEWVGNIRKFTLADCIAFANRVLSDD